MKDTPAKLLLIAACALPAVPALAAEYKWVDADGGIVYGDIPPSEDAVPLRTSGGITRTIEAGKPDPLLQLPMALRTAARAQPVVIYSANDCEPCQMARAHLKARGIPFQEWLVSSHADFERFRSLGFTSNGFPAITIGQQRHVGFESSAWDRSLDSAGYPQSSLLPSSYQYPAVKRLTEDAEVGGNMTITRPQSTLRIEGNAARPLRAERPPTRAADNPGIRF